MDNLFLFISNFCHKKINNLDDFEKLKNEGGNIYYFFAFLLKKDNLTLFNEINAEVSFVMQKYYTEKIKNVIPIKEVDYFFLQTVFILKSLKKSNFDMIKEVDQEISIDHVLNHHISFEKKFWIFEKKELYPNCNKFRKEIFKLYSLLAIKKIISEKITNYGIKSQKQWVLDYDDFENSEFEKFKISFSPYKIFEIRDRYFLMSNFFTLTTEVFKQNIHSSKRFNLKEKNYLNNICNVGLYFDEEMFDIIYKKKVKEESVKDEILLTIKEMRQIREEIEILSDLNKNEYIIKFKKLIKNDILFFKEVNLLIPFKKFLYIWVRKNFNRINCNLKELNPVWDYLINIIATKNYLEIEESFFEKILEENNFKILEILKEGGKEVSPLLDEKHVSHFVENDFRILIKIYKNLNLENDIKKDYGLEMKDIRILRFKLREKQSKLSELYNLNILELIRLLKDQIRDKKLFFPLFYDFRGRMYVHSSACITNYKLSRYFFHYGWYEEKEIEYLNKISIPEIHNFNGEILKLKIKFNIARLSNAIDEGIFWCLIAVGKEYINKNKISTSTEEIIQIGLKKIISINMEEEDEKWIIIEHYKKIISSYNLKIIPKKIILKDATASFIQNTIRIIGPKNLKSLEYANLYSNSRWYDTYTLALETWKNSLTLTELGIKIDQKLINEDYLSFFTRKTIKKPVMTDSYEASYLSQLEYFKVEVKKNFNFEFDIKSDLELLFKNFINFLDKNFWNNYYLYEDSDIMIKYVENLLKNQKDIIISSSDGESNMMYYKFKNKTIDVIVKISSEGKGFRKTKQFLVLDEDNLNTRKIKSAIKPNWVHFSDAYLIRQINSLMPSFLFTVHDCFLVDNLSVSNFINNSNKAFKQVDSFSIAKNKDLLDKIRSLYIFF